MNYFDNIDDIYIFIDRLFNIVNYKNIKLNQINLIIVLKNKIFN